MRVSSSIEARYGRIANIETDELRIIKEPTALRWSNVNKQADIRLLNLGATAKLDFADSGEKAILGNLGSVIGTDLQAWTYTFNYGDNLFVGMAKITRDLTTLAPNGDNVSFNIAPVAGSTAVFSLNLTELKIDYLGNVQVIDMTSFIGETMYPWLSDANGGGGFSVKISIYRFMKFYIENDTAFIDTTTDLGIGTPLSIDTGGAGISLNGATTTFENIATEPGDNLVLHTGTSGNGLHIADATGDVCVDTKLITPLISQQLGTHPCVSGAAQIDLSVNDVIDLVATSVLLNGAPITTGGGATINAEIIPTDTASINLTNSITSIQAAGTYALPDFVGAYPSTGRKTITTSGVSATITYNTSDSVVLSDGESITFISVPTSGTGSYLWKKHTDLTDLESKTQNIDLIGTVPNTTQLNGGLKFNATSTVELKRRTDTDLQLQGATNATFTVVGEDAVGIRSVFGMRSGGDGVFMQFDKVANTDPGNSLCIAHQGSVCDAKFFRDGSCYLGNDFEYNEGNHDGKADGVHIQSGTASSSTTTGALKVSGGAGITGDVFIGGDLDVAGSIINTTSPTEIIPDETANITLSKKITVIKDGGKKSLPNYVGAGNSSKTITIPSRWDVITDSANGPVHAIFADGNDVYFGGDFTTIGGISANRIAMWNGSTWSAFSTGFNDIVWDIKKFGGNIYACGEFSTPVTRIAMWNGSSWQGLGTGLESTGYSMTEFNSELVVAGGFQTAGGITVNNIASWNGSTWSDLNGGFDGNVYNIKVIGSDLYVGGVFSNNTATIPVPASNVASWNGTVWSALAGGISGAYVTAIEANGTDIYFGGDFTIADPGGLNISVFNIALWNGSSWSALSGSINGRTINWITLIGSDIVVVGEEMTSADGNITGNVARWDGSAWFSVGEGIASTTSIAAAYRIEITPYGNMIGGDFDLVGGRRIDNCCFYSNVDKSTITYNNDAESILIYPGDTVEFNSTTAGAGYKWYVSPQTTSYDELGIATGKINFTPILDPKILLDGDMFYHNVDKRVKVFDSTSVKPLAYSSDLTDINNKTQNISLADTSAGLTKFVGRVNSDFAFSDNSFDNVIYGTDITGFTPTLNGITVFGSECGVPVKKTQTSEALRAVSQLQFLKAQIVSASATYQVEVIQMVVFVSAHKRVIVAV
jgi:hypothetical protein